MKRLLWIMALSMVLLMAGCGVADLDEVVDKAKETAVTEETSEADGTHEMPAAVDFTLTSSKGEEISLSDYEGKIVFLNFFTTWCVYCDQEMPDFQATYDAYDGDVVFLLVDVFQQERIDREGVIAWYEERGYTMPMVIDEEGITDSMYPVRAFPTTFVVNREGNVFGYLEGAMSQDMIDGVIEQIDAE